MNGARYASRQRARHRSWIIGVSTVLIVLLALGGAGAYLWSQFGDRISLAMGWSSNDYEGEGHGEVIVTIASGEIGSDVAATLTEAGVVKSWDAFYELLLAQQPAVEFHPGSYRLKLEMSAQAALDALQDPANRMQYIAMIPEGLTVAQSLEIVAAGAQLPLEELLRLAEDPQAFGLPAGIDSLEGWLHPATYEFEPDTTAHDAIATLVDHQVLMLDSLGVPAESRQEVLTIASIVQREAGTVDDFGRVSRVIYNRLEIGMRLEMDSTAQFGMGQHDDGSVWSSSEALVDDNPWNTYVHEGLPYGPIANPGRAAVEATLSPAQGPWLFFVAVNLETGESVFSETLDEHHAATEQLFEWCAAHPNANC